MSNDPLIVSLTRVVEFLKDIGLDPVDPKDLKSVHIDPGVMTVVRWRRNEAGHQVIVGDGEPDSTCASETTTIRVEIQS